MRKWTFIVFLIGSLVVGIYLLVVLPPMAQKSALAGETAASDTYLPLIFKPRDTFYVSKLGNNGDGFSWETAWNELDQIDWSIIQPGHTILIDGGSTEMVYTTTLEPTASGTPGQPVTIKLAEEAGRDGKVIIFGGRSTPLPYCGQTEYVNQTNNVRKYGIELNDVSWLVVDGTKWRGITIYGHSRNGMRYYFNTSNITTRYVEIYDNGWADLDNGEWQPDSAGVRIGGPYHLFERVIIHDNGHDAIQSATGSVDNKNNNNLGNLTIRQSWLYNGRPHPTEPRSFNYCGHADGLQIYNGGIVSNITFEESIIGPGLTNGVILGQTLTESGAQAVVNNVTFSNVLFMKADDNSILAYTGTSPTGWTLDYVTADCSITSGHCVRLPGSNNAVTNSIFVGSRLRFTDGLDIDSNNCRWNTTDFELGIEANPQFVSVDDSDPFSLDDYTLSDGSPCSGRGSSITSVTQLLSLTD
jgi:hypothetical protein